MQGIVEVVHRGDEDLETHVMEVPVRVVTENASVVKADMHRATNNMQNSASFISILIASFSTSRRRGSEQVVLRVDYELIT